MNNPTQYFFNYRNTIYIPVNNDGYYVLPGGHTTTDMKLLTAVAERMFKMVKGNLGFKPKEITDRVKVTLPSGVIEYTTIYELGKYCKERALETTKAKQMLEGSRNQYRGYIFEHVKSN